MLDSLSSPPCCARPPVPPRVLPNETENASPASSASAAGAGAAAGAADDALYARLALTNQDVMTHLVPFIDHDDHLFVAGVSRSWSSAWKRPRKTRGMSATTTASQLQASFDCGLRRNMPMCLLAARLKKLDLLQVAMAAGCPWDVAVAIELARGGYFEILKWARAVVNPIPWNHEVCDFAAEFGHMELVMWLRENKCPCTPRTMAGIAANAGLAGTVLRRVRKTGATWDVATANNLARRGFLGTLMWAVQEGCPVDKATIAAAARGGHLDVLVWLRRNGCYWDPDHMLAGTCVPRLSRCAADAYQQLGKRLPRNQLSGVLFQQVF